MSLLPPPPVAAAPLSLCLCLGRRAGAFFWPIPRLSFPVCPDIVADTGSMRPWPSFPSPVPTFHPIICKSLWPMPEVMGAGGALRASFSFCFRCFFLPCTLQRALCLASFSRIACCSAGRHRFRSPLARGHPACSMLWQCAWHARHTWNVSPQSGQRNATCLRHSPRKQAWQASGVAWLLPPKDSSPMPAVFASILGVGVGAGVAIAWISSRATTVPCSVALIIVSNRSRWVSVSASASACMFLFAWRALMSFACMCCTQVHPLPCSCVSPLTDLAAWWNISWTSSTSACRICAPTLGVANMSSSCDCSSPSPSVVAALDTFLLFFLPLSPFFPFFPFFRLLLVPAVEAASGLWFIAIDRRFRLANFLPVRVSGLSRPPPRL